GFDKVSQKIREEIVCPHCSAVSSKNRMDLQYTSHVDPVLKETVKIPKRVPVLINYNVGKARYEKQPDAEDFKTIARIESLEYPAEVPTHALPDMQMLRVGRMQPSEIKHLHQFFLPREAHALAALWRAANKT